jgi:uncharacterized protein YjdB
MKRLIHRLASASALVLSLALALSLASCGGSKDKGGGEAAGVSVNPTTLELVEGGSSQMLTATVVPANASDRHSLVWTVEPEDVVTVTKGADTESGGTAAVAPLAVGTAKVTVTTTNGNFAECYVTVEPPPVHVNDIFVTPTTMSLAVGVSAPIVATILPGDATDKGVTWTSLPTGIVTISGSGLNVNVTGAAAGDTIVTATTRDGGHKAECAVHVTLVAAEPAIFVGGNFGLYINGFLDASFGDARMHDIFVDDNSGVHAIGQFHDAGGSTEWESAYFFNGAPTILPMSHSDYESNATGVTVAPNGDVYVTGTEYWGTRSARLWKKPAGGSFAISTLGGTDEIGDGDWSYANAVHVHNGDVFVVGSNDKIDWYDRPVIWKNGVEYMNEDLEDHQILDFGITPDGILHVLNFNRWWEYDGEDGPASLWNVPASNPSQWTRVPLPGLSTFAQLTHVFVEGDDYYVVGYVNDDAYYWMDGGAAVQLPHPAGAAWVEADDVHVLDGHVYVAGCAAVGTDPGEDYEDMYAIVQWIDGAIVTGPRQITVEIPGPAYSYARVQGLFVKPIVVTPATSVTVTPNPLNIPVGWSGTLTAAIAPPETTIKGVAWSSSNPAVATVTGGALTVTINGLTIGQATISATSPDGPVGTAVVNVQNTPATDLTIAPTSILMGALKTRTITATVAPPQATNKNVTWESSNQAVAAVSFSGAGATCTVTSGSAAGSAVITARTVDGGIPRTCSVTVDTTIIEPVIYIGGDFGLYIDAEFDTAIGGDGDEMIYDLVVDDASHFHAVGYHWDADNSHWAPGYYRDNVSVTLPVTNPTGHDGGRSIAYANGNIYIAGDEYVPAESKQVPVLWTGSATGTSFTQTVLPHEFPVSYADTVRVVGSDVYVSGGSGQDSNARPVIWKNGTRHDFVGTNDWFHEFGFATDGRIFALGESGAEYQISADLTTCTPVSLSGSGYTIHMFVSGNDVYTAGWHGNEACYWKNGAQYDIQHPAEFYWVEADDIYVHDDQLYIAGFGSHSAGGYRFLLWIDGVVITDNRAIQGSIGWPEIQVLYVH